MQSIDQSEVIVEAEEIGPPKPQYLDVNAKRMKPKNPLSYKNRGRPPKALPHINVRDKCDALGCDPYTIMALIAMGDHEALRCRPEEMSASLRLKAATELATYLAPKLKSIEIDRGDKKQENVFVVTLPESGRELVLPEGNSQADEDDMEDLEDMGLLDDGDDR